MLLYDLIQCSNNDFKSKISTNGDYSPNTGWNMFLKFFVLKSFKKGKSKKLAQNLPKKWFFQVCTKMLGKGFISRKKIISFSDENVVSNNHQYVINFLWKKMWKHEKGDFNQQIACKAPVCWSKSKHQSNFGVLFEAYQQQMLIFYWNY